MRPFEPLFSSPHLLTIAGNFWKRKLDTVRFPVADRLFPTEPGTQVRVLSQRPSEPNGAIVMVHGLEGSGESGYMVSLAQAGLDAGYSMHRFHMRTCGGTAHLTTTLYHAGMTGDLLSVIRQLRAEGEGPFVLVGFSLGGNVVLKLAGELGGGAAAEGVAAVCAVSVPIDLAACARRLRDRDNFYYERRFVKRMIGRLISTGRYKAEDFRGIRSIWDIDDRITAPHFSFGRAEDYYGSQSSIQFLPSIRVPAQIVQSKDDTFIPFEIFDCAELRSNPRIRLIATERGGHIGYLARTKPRFWVDEVIVEFARTYLTARETSASVDKTIAPPITRSAMR